MELSYALSTPAHVLRRMPAADLQTYAAHARRHGFPGRRMEWYLAQLAYILAAANGAKNVGLGDFLHQPFDDDDLQADAQPTDQDIADIKAALGYKPRHKHKPPTETAT